MFVRGLGARREEGEVFRGGPSVSQTGFQTFGCFANNRREVDYGYFTVGDVFCKGSSPVGNFPLTTISFTCSVSSPYTGRTKLKKKN